MVYFKRFFLVVMFVLLIFVSVCVLFEMDLAGA